MQELSCDLQIVVGHFTQISVFFTFHLEFGLQVIHGEPMWCKDIALLILFQRESQPKRHIGGESRSKGSIVSLEVGGSPSTTTKKTKDKGREFMQVVSNKNESRTRAEEEKEKARTIPRQR